MTKQEVLSLIDGIADKTSYKDVSINHLVNIGDVLQKIKETTAWQPEGEPTRKLLHYWSLCGFKKSLQQIVEESWWKLCGELSDSENACWDELKSPEAHALFEFLADLFPESK